MTWIHSNVAILRVLLIQPNCICFFSVFAPQQFSLNINLIFFEQHASKENYDRNAHYGTYDHPLDNHFCLHITSIKQFLSLFCLLIFFLIFLIKASRVSTQAIIVASTDTKLILDCIILRHDWLSVCNKA